jgi:hypothetical protein
MDTPQRRYRPSFLRRHRFAPFADTQFRIHMILHASRGGSAAIDRGTILLGVPFCTHRNLKRAGVDMLLQRGSAPVRWEFCQAAGSIQWRRRAPPKGRRRAPPKGRRRAPPKGRRSAARRQPGSRGSAGGRAPAGNLIRGVDRWAGGPDASPRRLLMPQEGITGHAKVLISEPGTAFMSDYVVPFSSIDMQGQSISEVTESPGAAPFDPLRPHPAASTSMPLSSRCVRSSAPMASVTIVSIVASGANSANEVRPILVAGHERLVHAEASQDLPPRRAVGELPGWPKKPAQRRGLCSSTRASAGAEEFLERGPRDGPCFPVRITHHREPCSAK